MSTSGTGIDHALRTPDAGTPPDRTRLATLSLHLSVAFCGLGGVLLALSALFLEPSTGAGYRQDVAIRCALALLGVALAVLAAVVGKGLRRRRRWAWNTAAVLFALYLPSVFFLLGAVGLYGLLSKGTRARFPPPGRTRSGS